METIIKAIEDRAKAAEASRVLLGSSDDRGGLAVFDAALALLDLRIAELEGLTKKGRDDG